MEVLSTQDKTEVMEESAPEEETVEEMADANDEEPSVPVEKLAEKKLDSTDQEEMDTKEAVERVELVSPLEAKEGRLLELDSKLLEKCGYNIPDTYGVLILPQAVLKQLLSGNGSLQQTAASQTSPPLPQQDFTLLMSRDLLSFLWNLMFPALRIMMKWWMTTSLPAMYPLSSWGLQARLTLLRMSLS
jgi:hypothetical protein